MARFVIHIRWTDWLDGGDPAFQETRALYVYASAREPYWIGDVPDKTILGAYYRHSEEDDVVEWIDDHCKTWWGIKVGCVTWPKDGNYSSRLLRDIQNCLIFAEAEAGRCRANVACGKTPSKWAREMTILNQGKYRPLRRKYQDTARGKPRHVS